MLCDAIGFGAVKKDPRFTSNGLRVTNRGTLIPLLEAEFMKRPRDEWLKVLNDVGFPCAPVYLLDELFSDPQVLERGMLREVDHPKAGKIKQVGPVLKMSGSPCVMGGPPPTLGQHTERVLKELAGYSEDEIRELRKKGAI
jgi:crotonobetainyl-CoA:carnitine CoA-transferase CaiB-like acyl-CoA transferase